MDTEAALNKLGLVKDLANGLGGEMQRRPSPQIENRPVSELARRFVPNYQGHMPAVLPAGWLASLVG